MVSEVQLLVPQDKVDDPPEVMSVGLAVKLSIEQFKTGATTTTVTDAVWVTPFDPDAVNVYVVVFVG